MKTRIMKRGETSGRSDDNEATVMKRIDTFHDNNQPIVDYYNKQRKLCTVRFSSFSPVLILRDYCLALLGT